MKYQVQGYEESIEIGQYRPLRDRKGALKATFSVVEYPRCRKTLECKYFDQGDSKWFSFPTKEIKKEGAKSDYIPLVSFGDKEFEKQLKIAILQALKEADAQVQTHPRHENPVEDESPFGF